VPRCEYETCDLEFTHGAIEAYSLSSAANAELERLYTAMIMYNTDYCRLFLDTAGSRVGVYR
jgi:hypothetical protein